MKILKISFLFILTALLFSSCERLEEDLFIYDGSALVEFDATAYNVVASGRTYPILTRVPGFGRPALTADPSLTRASGTVKFRVNLTTAQFPQDQVLSYTVVATEKNAAGADVVVTTAVSGVHYTTSGTFTIPANTSFGEVTVQIINPGITSATARDLVLEITGNDVVKPSPNYSKLGLRISQI
jgi:hypothetical protein